VPVWRSPATRHCPPSTGYFCVTPCAPVAPTTAPGLEALQRVVNRLSVNGVDQVVEALLQAAGPIDPRTDANTIIISMAPEAYRLGAAWWSFRGQHERALRLAGRAVELYRPIRDRFPTRVAITLAEQAEYAFRWQPRKAQAALELVDTAIAELPNIQGSTAPQSRASAARGSGPLPDCDGARCHG
jgi:hypothetical protein